MPFSSCDPCCDPASAARDNQTFKLAVLQALCTLISENSPIQTVADLVTIAFGSLTNTFATTGITGISEGYRIKVWNGTDDDIYLNWDGTADAKNVVLAGGEQTVQAPSGATTLYIRYVAAPSSGNVYLSPGV